MLQSNLNVEGWLMADRRTAQWRMESSKPLGLLSRALSIALVKIHILLPGPGRLLRLADRLCSLPLSGKTPLLLRTSR